MLDAFLIVPNEPCEARAGEGWGEQSTRNLLWVFSRGWCDGVLSNYRGKQLCAPSAVSFVLQLPDDTSPRPQSLPKIFAVSDLLPETIQFRLGAG